MIFGVKFAFGSLTSDMAFFIMSYGPSSFTGNDGGHQNVDSAMGIALQIEQKDSNEGSYLLHSQDKSTLDSEKMTYTKIFRNYENS